MYLPNTPTWVKRHFWTIQSYSPAPMIAKQHCQHVIKKTVFHVCPNDCIVFRNSPGAHYASLNECPKCGETRYREHTRKPYTVHKITFSYIPVGPRLATIYGESNLSKIVLQYPGNEYQGEEMWEIHHSSVWEELYGNDGCFARDKMGLSLALELDGVNHFHNIGVQYSMTPILIAKFPPNHHTYALTSHKVDLSKS